LENKIEPERKTISDINKQLETDLFFLFNNMDLRHNNKTIGNKQYHQYVSQMSNDDLEDWYDEIYQMALLAILLLDHNKRANKIKELKTNFNT